MPFSVDEAEIVESGSHARLCMCRQLEGPLLRRGDRIAVSLPATACCVFAAACQHCAGAILRSAVLAMLRAAEGLPRDELLLRLLRELRQGSVGVGQVVVSLSIMPAGPALLRPHIKVRTLPAAAG